MHITSGPHLGVVRNWIKHKARNGSDVRWGSSDVIEMYSSLTPFEMEQLAQSIRDAVLEDLRRATGTCDNFELDYTSEEAWVLDRCINCWEHRSLHKEKR